MRASLALLALASATLFTQTPLSAEPLSTRVSQMKHLDGYLPLDWDEKTGRIYLEIPHLDTEMIWVDSLPWGTGSNDLGLDRGQLGQSHIVRFTRVGPKVLLVASNTDFRSNAADPQERETVKTSFPESVLYGFKVEAESTDGKTVLVDATDFALSDSHGIAETIARLKQGNYKLDATRSAIDAGNSKTFPRNTELEGALTFTTDMPLRRGWVADVTPDPHAITVHVRQSFVELPEPGFTPRRFDPRAGYFDSTWRDYTTPLGETLNQEFIIRHRLVKADPNCVKSCVAIKPIQYYVDSGASEPMRSALVEGARWWDQAFQQAGWAPGTFKVDVLPPGADPMDVRYNMITWVHRYTRGWSYGHAVTDPRTGEIIKGNVTLGSLRGRQDYLIAEAVLAPYKNGVPTPENDPMLKLVVARIRQLAAHETGHTLGLAHNYIDSTLPHDAEHPMSVMEYPHPYFALDASGVPDASHAYQVNIGAWDKVAINYGYREFDKAGKPVEDDAALKASLEESEKNGLVFITDEDSRPLGSAHPHAHLWDNGADPAAELTRVLGVRKVALDRFGENNIRPGAPMAQLADTLVPLYLLHRYQVEAATKEIGGLDYRYNLRGDAQMSPAIVSPAEQRKALAAVTGTLSPQVLTLPEHILKLIPPVPPGLERTRESFPSRTGLTFDPVASAESAADLTLQLLFNPQRASRLVQYHAREASAPSLEEVIDTTLKATGTPLEGGLESTVQRAVDARILDALLGLASNPEASAEARAIAATKVGELRGRLSSSTPTGQAAIARIEDWRKNPDKFTPAKPLEAPPGMPIGDGEDY